MKETVLLPVDGSANALRAVDAVIDMASAGTVGDLHLINVQTPLTQHAPGVVGHKAVTAYHQEEGQKALAEAKAKLDAAGVPYHAHIGLGRPGDVIDAYIRQYGCNRVVMGTRGHGKAVGLVLGSVSRDVQSRAGVPVTLVK